MVEGVIDNASKRETSVLTEKPQSTKIAVPPLSMIVALPLLPLPSEAKRIVNC
jgi:hypothetical protein